MNSIKKRWTVQMDVNFALSKRINVICTQKRFEQHKLDVGINTANANVYSELRKKIDHHWTSEAKIHRKLLAHQAANYPRNIFLVTRQGQRCVERPVQLMEKTCIRIDYLPRLMEDRYGVDLSLISERCRRWDGKLIRF